MALDWVVGCAGRVGPISLFEPRPHCRLYPQPHSHPHPCLAPAPAPASASALATPWPLTARSRIRSISSARHCPPMTLSQTQAADQLEHLAVNRALRFLALLPLLSGLAVAAATRSLLCALIAMFLPLAGICVALVTPIVHDEDSEAEGEGEGEAEAEAEAEDTGEEGRGGRIHVEDPSVGHEVGGEAAAAAAAVAADARCCVGLAMSLQVEQCGGRTATVASGWVERIVDELRGGEDGWGTGAGSAVSAVSVVRGDAALAF